MALYIKTVCGREVVSLLIICVFTSMFVITIKQMVPKKIVCSQQLKPWQAAFPLPQHAIKLNRLTDPVGSSEERFCADSSRLVFCSPSLSS